MVACTGHANDAIAPGTDVEQVIMNRHPNGISIVAKVQRAIRRCTSTATPTLAWNTDVVANAFRKSQNPRSCMSARFYVWRPHLHGLASSIQDVLLTSFVCAVATNRVFVTPNGSCVYCNPKVCPQLTYDCYLNPLTNCTETSPTTIVSRGGPDSKSRIFYGNQNKCRKQYMDRLYARLGVPASLGVNVHCGVLCACAKDLCHVVYVVATFTFSSGAVGHISSILVDR